MDNRGFSEIPILSFLPPLKNGWVFLPRHFTSCLVVLRFKLEDLDTIYSHQQWNHAPKRFSKHGKQPVWAFFSSHWHARYFTLVHSFYVHIIVLALQNLFLKFSLHFPGQGTGNCQRKIQSLKIK